MLMGRIWQRIGTPWRHATGSMRPWADWLGRSPRRNGGPMSRRRTQLGGGELLEIRDVMSADPLACIAMPATVQDPQAALAAEVSVGNTFESADAMTDYLVSSAVERYRSMFGMTQHWYWDPVILRMADGAPADFAYVAPSVSLTANTSLPESMNHQVVGVREADVSETDGRYVYTVVNGQLVITDTSQPAELSVVSRIAVDGQAQSIYLLENRVVVLSTEYQYVPPAYQPIYLDYWMAPSRPSTLISVFDVSDRTQPAELSSTEIESLTVDSRMIGETLYLVSSSDFALPAPMFVEDPTALPSSNGDAAMANLFFPIDPARNPGMRYETEEEYVARIRPLAIDLVLPQWGDHADGDTELEGQYLVSAGEILRPDQADDMTLITVTTWDLAGTVDVADAHAQIASNSPVVYMNHDSIVLATQDWDLVPSDDTSNVADGTTVASNWTTTTELDYFAIDTANGEIDFEGSGEILGTLIDRYSIDEQDGVVRLATVASQFNATQRVSNDIYTLQLNDGALAEVGSIHGIAPGETIRSVRFAGDRAYVVTFPVPTFDGRFFDPLFVINLADPTAPSVLGELEVSGFSTRMMVLDETHLLGIGREIDPTTNQDMGLQISLFDVSDPAAPTLVDRHLFAGWASSEAEWDLHAITYDAATGLLVLPVNSFGTTAWRPIPMIDSMNFIVPDGQFENAPTSGLQVLQIDLTTGFDALGMVPVAGGNVRSMLHGNTLVTRSETHISTYSLSDLGTPLDTVVLLTRAESDQFVVPESSDDTLFEINVLANDMVVDGGELTIVHVNDPFNALTIAADGKSLLFDMSRLSTPNYRLNGYSSWYFGDYTIRDSNGDESLSSLSIILPPTDDVIIYPPADPHDPPDPTNPGDENGSEGDAVMEFDAEFVDGNGQSISTITVGAEFFVNIYVEDSRDDARGVFSAFTDVEFVGTGVDIDSAIERGEKFGQGSTGSIVSDGVDELGGLGGLDRTGSGRQLLARIAVTARETGALRVNLNAPDLIWSDNTVYDRNTEVMAVDIVFGSDELLVVDETIRTLETDATDTIDGDVDGDGIVTPFDALLIINAMTGGGSAADEQLTANATVISQSSPAAQRSATGQNWRYDQDGDGEVSPLDAIRVINKL